MLKLVEYLKANEIDMEIRTQCILAPASTVEIRFRKGNRHYGYVIDLSAIPYCNMSMEDILIERAKDFLIWGCRVGEPWSRDKLTPL